MCIFTSISLMPINVCPSPKLWILPVTITTTLLDLQAGLWVLGNTWSCPYCKLNIFTVFILQSSAPSVSSLPNSLMMSAGEGCRDKSYRVASWIPMQKCQTMCGVGHSAYSKRCLRLSDDSWLGTTSVYLHFLSKLNYYWYVLLTWANRRCFSIVKGHLLLAICLCTVCIVR